MFYLDSRQSLVLRNMEGLPISELRVGLDSFQNQLYFYVSLRVSCEGFPQLWMLNAGHKIRSMS